MPNLDRPAYMDFEFSRWSSSLIRIQLPLDLRAVYMELFLKIGEAGGSVRWDPGLLATYIGGGCTADMVEEAVEIAGDIFVHDQGGNISHRVVTEKLAEVKGRREKFSKMGERGGQASAQARAQASAQADGQADAQAPAQAHAQPRGSDLRGSDLSAPPERRAARVPRPAPPPRRTSPASGHPGPPALGRGPGAPPDAGGWSEDPEPRFQPVTEEAKAFTARILAEKEAKDRARLELLERAARGES